MSIVMAGEQYFRNTFFNPLKYIDGFIYVSNFAKGIQEKHMPLIKAKPSIILYNFSESIAIAPKYSKKTNITILWTFVIRKRHKHIIRSIQNATQL